MSCYLDTIIHPLWGALGHFVAHGECHADLKITSF